MIEIKKINHHTFSIKTNCYSGMKYYSQLNESIIESFHFISNMRECELHIKAVSVQPMNQWFKERMSYEDVIKLMVCINQQQQTLLENGYSFYTLNIEDILILHHHDENKNENDNDNEDNYSFFCINPKHICSLNKDKSTFILTSIYSKSDFCSPELVNCSQLPDYTISTVSFYYTLASLIYYCFFKEVITSRNRENNLNSILYTPLYWFFQRGLHENIYSRKCLFLS